MQIDAVLGAALEIYNYSNESEVLAILGGKYGKEPVMDQCPDIMDSIHYTSPEDDIIKMGYEFLLKNREKKQ